SSRYPRLASVHQGRRVRRAVLRQGRVVEPQGAHGAADVAAPPRDGRRRRAHGPRDAGAGPLPVAPRLPGGGPRERLHASGRGDGGGGLGGGDVEAEGRPDGFDRGDVEPPGPAGPPLPPGARQSRRRLDIAPERLQGSGARTPRRDAERRRGAGERIQGVVPAAARPLHRGRAGRAGGGAPSRPGRARAPGRAGVSLRGGGTGTGCVRGGPARPVLPGSAPDRGATAYVYDGGPFVCPATGCRTVSG